MLILGPQLVAMGWLQKSGDRWQMVELEDNQTYKVSDFPNAFVCQGKHGTYYADEYR